MMRHSVRIASAIAALFLLANGAYAQVVLTEGFNSVDNILGIPTSTPGWVNINNSVSPGAGYFQGDVQAFHAQAGPASAYIGVNFESTTVEVGGADLSNWLLTPTITGIKNGFEIRFWTRTVEGSNYADRLEVRLSTNGSSTDVGSTPASVGDFTTLLGSVNPTLSVPGYPEDWTEIVYTVSGVETPTDGRFAFRYFVPDGGWDGTASNYIGIDTLTITAPTPVPEPTGLLLFGIAAGGAIRFWRRRVCEA